jgi:hypothetical protein
MDTSIQEWSPHGSTESLSSIWSWCYSEEGLEILQQLLARLSFKPISWETESVWGLIKINFHEKFLEHPILWTENLTNILVSFLPSSFSSPVSLPPSLLPFFLSFLFISVVDLSHNYCCLFGVIGLMGWTILLMKQWSQFCSVFSRNLWIEV